MLIKHLVWYCAVAIALHSIASAALAAEAAVEDTATRIRVYPIATRTLTESQALRGESTGEPAMIAGELRLPRVQGRVPVVILVHGSGGAGNHEDRWSHEINDIGIGTFILDSFTGRDVSETITDFSRLPHLAMIIDAYRALAVVAKNPRVDPARIALMGFSKGGFVALYSSLRRFQRAYSTPGLEFAAFIPFYAPCNRRFINEDDVSDRPIRLFHGRDDDWSRIAFCRQYAEHARSRGRDVQLVEFENAGHGFDVPTWEQGYDAQAENPGGCTFEERPEGLMVNPETGRPLTHTDTCYKQGASIKYSASAAQMSRDAVKAFLLTTFGMPKSVAH
jgi:dienelactone hydrolase